MYVAVSQDSSPSPMVSSFLLHFDGRENEDKRIFLFFLLFSHIQEESEDHDHDSLLIIYYVLFIFTYRRLLAGSRSWSFARPFSMPLCGHC